MFCHFFDFVIQNISGIKQRDQHVFCKYHKNSISLELFTVDYSVHIMVRSIKRLKSINTLIVSEHSKKIRKNQEIWKMFSWGKHYLKNCRYNHPPTLELTSKWFLMIDVNYTDINPIDKIFLLGITPFTLWMDICHLCIFHLIPTS